MEVSETVTNTTMVCKDAAPQQPSGNSSECFDCNICLDLAVDPVVTLCGHLYCWPCIYKWLQVEDSISPQSCPVCKASLSEESLVPLYGRGTAAKRHYQGLIIPPRPPVHHHLHSHYDESHGGEPLSSPLTPRLTTSTAGVVLGEMAVAVLPWVFRNHQATAEMAGGLYYSSPYGQAGGSIGGSRRLRRQEMQVERWLNQIWVFLFCCALLCLVLF